MTVPTGLGASVLTLSRLRLGVGCVGPEPPAMNSVSVEPPAVSVEKPMPNCMSPLGDDPLVLTQPSVAVSTWNSSPEL